MNQFVAPWQLKQSGARIHSHVLTKLIKYFESKYSIYKETKS